jgi:hypothetical protein
MIARTVATLALAAVAQSASAQVAPQPSFSLLGYIQQLDVDDLSEPLSKGRVRVNGIDVTLPKNLLITMPGQYLTLNDLFRGKKPATPASNPNDPPILAAANKPSGLALADAIPPDGKPPRVPFEIQLIGNIVNGEYIAGLAKITQQDLNTGTGFVRAIDHAKGELLVGPPTGMAAARVRLNDPLGRFGKTNAAKGAPLMDERFSLDPDNAAVVAMTGFPMCIPRDAAGDADCPSTNRHPSERRFTCGPISVEPTAPALPGCDAGKRAPLQLGDYVTYAGMLVEESPNNFFIAAHALGANTGIYTSPGRDPSYVFIEETIVGVLGDIFPPIDQEETSRFHIVGFATDPSRTIDVFMVDVAADGSESERLMTRLQPSLVGQIGRFRATLPSKANFLPATRDVRARLTGIGAPTPIGGAPTPFQYTIPVGEYIYPEVTRFGQKPSFPVPVPFENFCFLKNGSGPLTTLGRKPVPGGPTIGRLSPFPDSGHALSQGRAVGTRACP